MTDVCESRRIGRCVLRTEVACGKEKNWVQTVPGKGWNTILRLYGPLETWFAKTWRPGHLFIRQQTAVVNVIRAHLAEFGIVAPVGRAAADQGRRHRTRQQDGADGLGHDDQGRTPQGPHRACGVNEIASDINLSVRQLRS